jgi:hypothetical protein
VWSLLSENTREAVPKAPFLRALPALNERLDQETAGGQRFVIGERVTEEWAIGAVSGHSVRWGAAFTLPMHREGGAWRMYFGRPAVAIMTPHSGPWRVSQYMPSRRRLEFQLILRRRERIELAKIWLDGHPVNVANIAEERRRPGEEKRGGAGLRIVTVSSVPLGQVPVGPHSAAAFATVGDNAAAVAWTFIVEEG